MFFTTLSDLLWNNNGVLTTCDALHSGVSKDSFYSFVGEAGLVKVSHGVYTSPDVLSDEFYLLQVRFPKAVFSHETALYLHDLSDMEPMPLTVSVDSNYNASGLKASNVKVHFTKPEWYSLGISDLISPFGNKIKVYDAERTVCDIIRKCDNMDIAVFNHAIREYVSRSDKNYSRLSMYAKTMHIEKKLRERIGVLL